MEDEFQSPWKPEYSSFVSYSSSDYQYDDPPQSSMDAILKSFADLDLRNESAAFSAWLDKKQRTTPSAGGLPSNEKIVNIEALSRLSNSEVEMLIKRLKKNNDAFAQWTEEKRKLELIRQKEEEMGQKRIAREEAEKAEAEKRKKIVASLRIKEWKQKKHLEYMKKKKIQQEEAAKKEKEHQARVEAGQKVYEEWKRVKAEQPVKTENTARKKAAWVHIATPPELHQDNVSAKKSNRKVVLSPPSLYNDYDLYQRCAPAYFRKYSNLVASGGREVQQQEQRDQKPKRRVSGRTATK